MSQTTGSPSDADTRWPQSDVCERSGPVPVPVSWRYGVMTCCASKRIHSLWFQCSPPAVHPDLSKWKSISARHTHLCSASLSLIAFCLATQQQTFPAVVLDHPADVMIPEDRQYLIASDLIWMNLGICAVIKRPGHVRYWALLFILHALPPPPPIPTASGINQSFLATNGKNLSFISSFTAKPRVSAYFL